MKAPILRGHAHKRAARLPDVSGAQNPPDAKSGRNRAGSAAVHSRAEWLQLQIQQELGIDMRRYASEEAVATLADLLSFPQYVLAYMLRPLGGALLLFALGFVFLDLAHIEYLLYLLLVPGLLLATALLFGLLALGWKIERDLRGVLEYTLGMLGSAFGDVQRAGAGIRQGNFRYTLTLLFQGTMHIVTIPTVSQVLSDRIPLIGSLFSRFIGRALSYLVDRFGQIEEVATTIAAAHENPQRWLAAFEASVQGLEQGLARLLNLSLRIAQLPLKIAFGLCLSMLVVVVWLLH
jgi:hypothetical protein